MADDRLTVDCLVAFRYLGISRNTGYSLIKAGKFPLPVIRAGKKILISKVAITKLLGDTEGSNDYHVGESKQT